MIRLLSKLKVSNLPVNLVQEQFRFNLASEQALFHSIQMRFSTDPEDGKPKKKSGFLNWKTQQSSKQNEAPEQRSQEGQQEQQSRSEGYKKGKARNPPKILFQNKSEDQGERQERAAQPQHREQGDTQRQRPRFEERRRPERQEGEEETREKRQPETGRRLLFQQVAEAMKVDQEELGAEFDEDTSAARRETSERRPHRAEGREFFFKMATKPGEILKRLAKEVELDKDAHVYGVDAETREKLLQKINSLDSLSKTTDVYQDLLETYLTLGELEKFQKVYQEMTASNVAKNPIIESFMLDAKTQVGHKESLEFFRSLKSNEDTLSKLSASVVQNFLQLQLREGSTNNVAEVVNALSKVHFNFSNLDLGVFSEFLGFKELINEDNISQLSKSRVQSEEILEKAKIFIHVLDLKFRVKKQRKTTIALFDFEKLFRVLVACSKGSPDKLGKSDVFLQLLKKLHDHKLLTEVSIHPDSVAEWVLHYSKSGLGLDRALGGIALLDSLNLNLQAALERAFKHSEDQVPFSNQDVTTCYKGLAAQAFIDSNTRVCGPQTLVVLCQIALWHKQYDIVLACYQNFEKFTKTTQMPASFSLIAMETFTYLNLKTKNASSVIEGIEKKAVGKDVLPKLKVTLLKVKALIRDEKFDEATALYREQVLNGFICDFHRTVLLNFFIARFPIVPLISQETADDTHEHIRNFVQSISDEELLRLNDSLRYHNDRITYVADAESMEEVRERVRLKKLESGELVEETGEEAAEEGEEGAEGEEAGEATEETGEAAEGQEEAAEESTEAQEEEAAAEENAEEAVEGGEEGAEEGEVTEEASEEAAQMSHAKTIEVSVSLVDLIFEDIELYNALEDSVRLDLSDKYVKNPRLAKTRYSFEKRSEASSTSITEEIQELIFWGIANKQHVAVELGRQFFDYTNQKMPEALHRQITLFNNYTLHSEPTVQSSYVKETLEVRRTVGPIQSDYQVIDDDKSRRQFIDMLMFMPDYTNELKIAQRKRSILRRELDGYLPPELREFVARTEKQIHQ